MIALLFATMIASQSPATAGSPAPADRQQIAIETITGKSAPPARRTETLSSNAMASTPQDAIAARIAGSASPGQSSHAQSRDQPAGELQSRVIQAIVG